MSKFLKGFHIGASDLHSKFMITFFFMAVIPLIIAVYLTLRYIFPNISNMPNVSFILLVTILISILGFWLAKQIFIDPIVKITKDVKSIACGNVYKKVSEVNRTDEIGALGVSLNELTRRIRNHMSELKHYSERTKQIDIEIHKKVFTLSALLQIAELISSSVEIEQILTIAVEKIAQLEATDMVMLLLYGTGRKEMILRGAHKVNSEKLRALRVKTGEGFLGKIAESGKRLIIDKSKEGSVEAEEFRKIFALKNGMVLPLTSQGKATGLLILGNTKQDFQYKEDVFDLINVFVGQIVIAVENDNLVKKAKELAVKDELTDLYNEKFIKRRLEEEIKRGITCQRPCSFIIFDIDDFMKFCASNSGEARRNALKKTAEIFLANIDEIDKAARIKEDRFAILLPEKNKKRTLMLAEKIREQIKTTVFKGQGSSSGKLTISGGVSENPIDGSTAKELFEKAVVSLTHAKEEGKDKIAG